MKNNIKKIKGHILLGVTGSIAAYKSADIIRRLQEKGYKVSVIMTEASKRFITPLTLSSLCQEEAYSGLFDDKDRYLNHIKLAWEASALLIAPATANIIGKLANGIADDLLSCIAIATEAPILIAPAMNDKMYSNKIVQENCKRLKQFGFKFIDPVKGKLACGTSGKGHLAEVEEIVKEVERTVR